MLDLHADVPLVLFRPRSAESLVQLLSVDLIALVTFMHDLTGDL